MPGYLFVIVGNSGVGKDSLLANFQGQVGAKSRFIFPKRWITRDLSTGAGHGAGKPGTV